MSSSLEHLLTLSRTLVADGRDLALSGALDAILAAAGCSRGAIYLARGEALELAAHAGLPAELREPLTRLPPWTAPWFVAQRAAQERRPMVDREVALRGGERIDRALVASSGWPQIAACPILAGRELQGVALVAAPLYIDLEHGATAALELGCDLLALAGARGGGPTASPTAPAISANPTLPGPPPMPRVSTYAPRDTEPPPTPVTHGVPPGVRVFPRSEAPSAPRPNRSTMPPAPSRRDRELDDHAHAIADRLRVDGPRRGASVIAMLRDRGLAETEALSVITFALASGVLTRDPAWSTWLKTPDPPPNRTVLLVDDDADLRGILVEVLEDQGYAVETAANGRDALDRLRGGEPGGASPGFGGGSPHRPPGVVVLDLVMPVMDGWQVLREMKQDAALAQIPVVVISSGKRPREAPPGIDGYLAKPIDFYELVTRIERTSKTRDPALT